MHNFKEHDIVVLTVDIPGKKLKAGISGTIVWAKEHCHVVQVEFSYAHNWIVVELDQNQIRSLSDNTFKARLVYGIKQSLRNLLIVAIYTLLFYFMYIAWQTL